MAVNTNTASVEELISIEGIGEDLADAIIRGRPYHDLQDLLTIRGIGQGTLANFKKQGLTAETKGARSGRQAAPAFGVAFREKALPMHSIPAGLPVRALGEDKPDDVGRFFCALPERVFTLGVVGDRVQLINLLGNKWNSGTLLRYYFFDRDTDGENVMFTNGTTRWRTWVGDAAQKEVVRQGFEAWLEVGIGVGFQEVPDREEA